MAVPASLAVLDPDAIAAGSVQHFEDLAPLVPNLNWSGEGSRARYFQIRGTGELEQYEGAPNPSVGFIVDDIDLSGIGGAATSFDVDRIEVLRGPAGHPLRRQRPGRADLRAHRRRRRPRPRRR